jgi:hypothetical protein
MPQSDFDVDIYWEYDSDMSATALFEQDGSSRFVPTQAAVGPWDRRLVHGAPIAALLAGQLTPAENTLARLTVEILAPVPMEPLTLHRSESTGGSRVQRQSATLLASGKEVATATSVIVRRGNLELPAKALAHESPFDPSAVPAMDEPNRSAAAQVGWDSFDSSSLVLQRTRVEGDRRTHDWISMVVPVVEGTTLKGTEIAAVAADYASNAVVRQLPYDTWSFRNADLTIHFAREPVGSWIGLRSECVVDSVGTGFKTADLFDTDGRMGRTMGTLVVERHDTRSA